MLEFDTLQQARDFNFDDLDRRFSHLSRCVQLFATDSVRFRENLHDVAISQFNIAENVADLYKDKVHTREVERFRAAHRNIISTYWNQYVSAAERQELCPFITLPCLISESNATNPCDKAPAGPLGLLPRPDAPHSEAPGQAPRLLGEPAEEGARRAGKVESGKG